MTNIEPSSIKMSAPPQKRRYPHTIRKLVNRLDHSHRSHHQATIYSSMERQIEAACIEVNDLYSGLQGLQKVCDIFDDILTAMFPLKVQPWSAHRQEIEDAQHELLCPANAAGTRLQHLLETIKNLQTVARRETPALVQDILLLERAVIDCSLDYSTFIYSLQGDNLMSLIEPGIFVEDRSDVLEGLSTHKKPISDGHIALPNIISVKIQRHLDEQLERNKHEDYRTNSFALPFSNLFQEDLEIWKLYTPLKLELRRLTSKRKGLTLRRKNGPANEPILKVSQDILSQVLILRDKVEASRIVQTRLGHSYLESGPQNAEIDIDMRRYAIKLQSCRTWIEEAIPELEKFGSEAIVAPENRILGRCDIVVLGNITMSLRPDRIDYGSLQAAGYPCDAKGEEEFHHYWYKALHPKAKDIHDICHRIGKVASVNDAYESSSNGLLRRLRLIDSRGLKNHAQVAVRCEEAARNMETLYFELPDSQFSELDAEMKVMVSKATKEQLRASELLVKSGGSPMA